MRKLPSNSILVCGLLLLLIALPGCLPETSTGGVVGTPVASAGQPVSLDLLPTPFVIVATATPAPSGFVPGDALPTPTLVPAATVQAYPDAIPTPTQSVSTTLDGQQYREITWEELVPPGYRPEDILAKYQVQLDSFQDGDPAAMDLYLQMQEEFNNAPVNSQLNLSSIKLPGFIAPLEYEGDLITEFLLVPYFGACIHVPPPPVNQTVYVSLASGEGLTPEEAYYPVWVHGSMTTEGLTTDIGQAGYRIQNAILTPYEY
jgi:hypothetical protein